MKRKIVVGLAGAGLMFSTILAFAGGMFPDYPVVGGATYCAGTSSSATGTIIGLVTGCPNQVPAGPTIVTGSEQIPADTRLASGAAPQTVLIGMASLNALPITVYTGATVGAATNASIVAAATSGGVLIVTTAALTGTTNIKLPASPINGQQFAISSNWGLTTLALTSANAVTAISNSAVSLTTSTTGAYGFRYMYNSTNDTWYRLQ